MFKREVKPQTLISTLWVFVLLNMIFRDMHEFPTDGYVEEMMTLKLSESTMLFYAFIVEIPIAMTVLSRMLNKKANKWANTIAVVLTSLGILYTLPNGDMDEYFFALVNAVAFIAIIRTAWELPSNKNTPEVRGMHQPISSFFINSKSKFGN